MRALRARWHVAALLALYALPVLGITAYFTLEELRGLTAAKNERAGLRQIAGMDAALFDLSKFAQFSKCGAVGSGQEKATARRIEAEMNASAAAGPFATAGWTAAHSAWSHGASADGVIDTILPSIGSAVSQISDRSGLTFDAQIGAVDLSDALTYRLPQAVSELERVRRDVCSTTMPALTVRVQIVDANARAQTLLDDAFFDINDAVENGGIDSSSLTVLERDVASRAGASSSAVRRFALGGGQASQTLASTAVTSAIDGLNALMHAATPQIDAVIDAHIADHRRRMALSIAEGTTAILAAVVIGFLLTRLIYQYAALSAAQRMAAESEHRAAHDPLTGLLNRRAFFAGGTNQGVICIVDVDDLKKINDTFGHAAGDCVLVHVAKVLQAAVRASDPVARLGGDEFAIFLRAPLEDAAADRILDKVFQALRAAIDVDGKAVRASVSIGTAAVTEPGGLEDAFARADEALYRAKRHARGSAMHAGFRCADA